MGVQFGPLGSSQILSVSGTSARVAFGAVPTISPAIAIVSLSPLINALYLKTGNAAVTASLTDSQRCSPGSSDDPLIVPISAGETNVAIITEGPVGDVVVTPGQYIAGKFTPVGAAQTIAVTNTDQRFALPTLGTSGPAFTLVSMQGLMDAIWIKTGNVTVTGSVTTSMKIMPGSADEPAVIKVTAGETHLSIFCEGAPGDIILTPGNVVGDAATAAGQFVAKAGDTMTGALEISIAASNVAAEYFRVKPTDFGTNKSYLAFKSSGVADNWQLLAWDGTDTNGILDIVATLRNNGAAVVAPASPAQGDVIYYNGTNWVRLAAGTSGNALLTQGAGANPIWGSSSGGITTIASGSLPAATTQSITNIPATYGAIILAIVGASSNTATREVRVQVSTNNGVSYDTTAANYSHIKSVIDYSGATNTQSVINTIASLIDSGNETAANTATHYIYITGYNGGPRMRWQSHSVLSGTTTTFYETTGSYLGSTSAINALQILWNGTGNFDAGTYALYGLN